MVSGMALSGYKTSVDVNSILAADPKPQEIAEAPGRSPSQEVSCEVLLKLTTSYPMPISR